MNRAVGEWDPEAFVEFLELMRAPTREQMEAAVEAGLRAQRGLEVAVEALGAIAQRAHTVPAWQVAALAIHRIKDIIDEETP